MFGYIFEDSLLLTKFYQLGNFLENLGCRISLTLPLTSILPNLYEV